MTARLGNGLAGHGQVPQSGTRPLRRRDRLLYIATAWSRLSVLQHETSFRGSIVTGQKLCGSVSLRHFAWKTHRTDESVLLRDNGRKDASRLPSRQPARVSILPDTAIRARRKRLKFGSLYVCAFCNAAFWLKMIKRLGMDTRPIGPLTATVSRDQTMTASGLAKEPSHNTTLATSRPSDEAFLNVDRICGKKALIRTSILPRFRFLCNLAESRAMRATLARDQLFKGWPRL